MENEELNKKEEIQNKDSQEQVQSRRDFLKKVGKGVLPIIGAAVLSSLPIENAEAHNWCNGCSGCCQGCTGSCLTTCRGGCNNGSGFRW